MHCLTDCDIRLATMLVRFDDIYSVWCGCNRKRIGNDFPNILEWLRDLVQTNDLLPIIANMANAKAYYFLSPMMNPFGHPENIRAISEEEDFESCLLVPSSRHTLASLRSSSNQAPALQRKISAHSTDGICTVSPSASSMVWKEKLDNDNMVAKTKEKSASVALRSESDVHSVNATAHRKVIHRKKNACRGRKKRTSRSRNSIRLHSSSRSRSGKLKGKNNQKKKKKSKGKRMSHRKKSFH